MHAAGDEILKKHILKASSISVMQSTCPKLYKISEFVCHLCGEETATDIISEVKESRVSILADEVRDCSNTEQMSFVI